MVANNAQRLRIRQQAESKELNLGLLPEVVVSPFPTKPQLSSKQLHRN